MAVPGPQITQREVAIVEQLVRTADRFVVALTILPKMYRRALIAP
jgi:hypothetical protein